MPQAKSPTMRRRRLGQQLREWRERANLDVIDAAEELDCSAGKIRHIENGRNAPGKTELAALARLYGIDDETRAALEQIRQEAAKPGWWRTARLSPALQTYVGAESDAIRVDTFHVELIPGLAQIEPYARAVNELAGSVNVERQVDVRKRRQERLFDEEDPLEFRAVISEAVLRRVAHTEYATAQFRHLVAMAERPNITIQVLPFSAGLHVSLNGGFVLLDFDPEVSLPCAYLEYVAGGDFVDDQVVVRRVQEKFRALQHTAMPAEESSHFIKKWI
jgi:transcriptional regulator with XRE-family HTH domain